MNIIILYIKAGMPGLRMPTFMEGKFVMLFNKVNNLLNESQGGLVCTHSTSELTAALAKTLQALLLLPTLQTLYYGHQV